MGVVDVVLFDGTRVGVIIGGGIRGSSTTLLLLPGGLSCNAVESVLLVCFVACSVVFVSVSVSICRFVSPELSVSLSECSGSSFWFVIGRLPFARDSQSM